MHPLNLEGGGLDTSTLFMTFFLSFWFRCTCLLSGRREFIDVRGTVRRYNAELETRMISLSPSRLQRYIMGLFSWGDERLTILVVCFVRGLFARRKNNSRFFLSGRQCRSVVSFLCLVRRAIWENAALETRTAHSRPHVKERVTVWICV